MLMIEKFLLFMWGLQIIICVMALVLLIILYIYSRNRKCGK